MNLRQFIIPCALLGLILSGVFYLHDFYKNEEPFYMRLKKRRRQPKYKLHNLQTMESSIVGDLNDGTSCFTFTLKFQSNDIIHFQINDRNNTRYVVKDVVLNNAKVIRRENLSLQKTEQNKSIVKYQEFTIELCSKPHFEIRIYKNKIFLLSFNSKNRLFIEKKESHVGISADFLFADASKAYGLPQHSEEITLKETCYQLYNSDRCAPGWKHWRGLYGAVPLIYAYGVNQTTGLLWLNASDTFVDIHYDVNGIFSTFFSESGILDFFVLSGPTVKECVKQNAQLTGVVPLPPIFSLGYHQSRYSYMSQDEVFEVLDNFNKNEVPLDCIWLDIDCTDGKKYFTWNPKTYPNPEKMLQYLDDKKCKAVVISDPHIKVDEDYFVYKECEKLGYMVKNPNHTTFHGDCWPGKSAWIDYFNPKARDYCACLYKNFAKAPNLFVWNDMNEPSVFGTKDTTMPKNLLHYGNWKHRDVHNLYPFYQTMATHMGLLKKDNIRPFILTRGHFAGSQRFAAIWTGDNAADWHHLKISIPMCLTSSLVGFSLCGADIGGFLNHPTDELLQRWYQVGCWLPFFRGHSNIDVPRREPYLYNEKVFGRIKKTILERYRHLLYWYTLFWEHSTTSSPVIRPLFYEYPQDPNVLDLDSQFLVGAEILVCPVLEEEKTEVDVYIPGGDIEIWYHIKPDGTTGQYNGGVFKIPADLDTVPVFYRGGSIIPIVQTPIQSSFYLHDGLVCLYIFCNGTNAARGTLYIDDTTSFDFLEDVYSYVKLEMRNLEISGVNINKNSKFKRMLTLSSIILYGFVGSIHKATLGGRNLKIEDTKILSISNIDINLCENFVIKLE